MKTKYMVVAGVLAVLVVGGVAWGFAVGKPADTPPAAQTEGAGCCVTGDCCCPGQGSCCDTSKRVSAEVAKTLTKAAGCCSTGQCCCPGQGSCCATSESAKSGEKECCATKSKGDCCSK